MWMYSNGLSNLVLPFSKLSRCLVKAQTFAGVIPSHPQCDEGGEQAKGTDMYRSPSPHWQEDDYIATIITRSRIAAKLPNKGGTQNWQPVCPAEMGGTEAPRQTRSREKLQVRRDGPAVL